VVGLVAFNVLTGSYNLVAGIEPVTAPGLTSTPLYSPPTTEENHR